MYARLVVRGRWHLRLKYATLTLPFVGGRSLFKGGPPRATAQRRRCLYPRVPVVGRHAPNHLAGSLRGTSRHHYLGGGLDEQSTLKLIP